MNTIPTNPNQEPTEELLGPELQREIVKSAQSLGGTVLEHFPDNSGVEVMYLEPTDDPHWPYIEPERGDEGAEPWFDLYYMPADDLYDEDIYFGKLQEWDARVLSFRQPHNPELEYGSSFGIRYPFGPTYHDPEVLIRYSVDSYDVEDVEAGTKISVEISIPLDEERDKEPAMIQETFKKDKKRGRHEPEEWRPMTQGEGRKLFEDLAELHERLQAHLASTNKAEN